MNEKTILFADDDPEIREALHLLLTCEGYETVEASCGREVLEKMDHTVDLVILDVMMPEMNGFSVCAGNSTKVLCIWRENLGVRFFF